MEESTVIIQNQAFNECFWKFIKEKVGIHKIYPSSGFATRSKNKKVLTMEQRQERIAIMLQKTDYDDDKLEPGDEELARW